MSIERVRPGSRIEVTYRGERAHVELTGTVAGWSVDWRPGSDDTIRLQLTEAGELVPAPVGLRRVLAWVRRREVVWFVVGWSSAAVVAALVAR